MSLGTKPSRISSVRALFRRHGIFDIWSGRAEDQHFRWALRGALASLELSERPVGIPSAYQPLVTKTPTYSPCRPAVRAQLCTCGIISAVAESSQEILGCTDAQYKS